MKPLAQTFIFYGGFWWLGFAAFHAGFWKAFDWKNELAKLTPVNKMIMQAADIIMIYLFLFFAYLSFAYAPVLMTQPLGQAVLVFWLGFWILRTGLQFLLGSTKSAASNITAALCIVMAVYYAVPVYILSGV